jgi:hypothetical protein
MLEYFYGYKGGQSQEQVGTGSGESYQLTDTS